MSRIARVSASLLPLLCALVVPSAHAAVFAECSGCSEAGYRTHAISLSAGGSQAVYIVDNARRAIRKFQVTVEEASDGEHAGTYLARAHDVPVESEVKDHARTIWQDLATLQKGFDTGYSSVTEYLRNVQVRGSVHDLVRDELFKFSTALRFASSNGILAAFRVSPGPYARFRFADGSEVIAQVGFAIELASDASFKVKARSLEPVPGSTRLRDTVDDRWVGVPMKESDFFGFQYGSRDRNVMDQIHNMIRHHDLAVTRMEGGGSDGVAISCARRGRETICEQTAY